MNLHPIRMEVVTEPAQPALGLVSLRDHLNIVGSGRDDLLELIAASVADALADEVGRTLLTTTYKAYFAGFPDADLVGRLVLPRPPIMAAGFSVSTQSTDGTLTAVASTFGVVPGDSGIRVPQTREVLAERGGRRRPRGRARGSRVRRWAWRR